VIRRRSNKTQGRGTDGAGRKPVPTSKRTQTGRKGSQCTDIKGKNRKWELSRNWELKFPLNGSNQELKSKRFSRKSAIFDDLRKSQNHLSPMF